MFDQMSNMINFRDKIKTNSMMSITPCKKCYIIKLVSFTIKFTSILYSNNDVKRQKI